VGTPHSQHQALDQLPSQPRQSSCLGRCMNNEEAMKELNNFADEKALLRMAQHARSLKRQGENCTT